ncbi:MAG: hypothetical protein QOG63_756 [Thermoleophilaceae bacterium]|jgi:hypothetical protein|nr:hypothetical protein [Thermoleophilaceae bacterium]
MRTQREILEVQRLASAGVNNCEIARRTGIPRSTIRTWLAGRTPQLDPASRARTSPPDLAALPTLEYAYLFGLYLGDGCLTACPRDVYKLRIALDSKYPRIIAACVASIRSVMPNNRTNVWKHPRHNVVEVNCHSKWWPLLFPQHGPGRKHERAILIDPWQLRLLDAEQPLQQLLRGLIHSDGCRVLNKVNGGVYPRYHFSNRSAEIRAIFGGACDELGIHWTQNNLWNLSVARRPDVARLDAFIGPKA